jgi:hypothetical protein
MKMGPVSRNRSETIEAKKYNISDTVRDNMENQEPETMQDSSDLTKASTRRKLLTLIYHRPSSLFADDDDMEGHEFYEESRRKGNNGKWCLKRVARRHLHHMEFEKLAKPFIDMNCPAVLLSDEDVMRASQKC